MIVTILIIKIFFIIIRKIIITNYKQKMYVCEMCVWGVGVCLGCVCVGVGCVCGSHVWVWVVCVCGWVVCVDGLCVWVVKSVFVGGYSENIFLKKIK